MKSIMLSLASTVFAAGTFSFAGAQSTAPSTSAPSTAAPAPAPAPPAFFPPVDQTTGVWQGCGPANNQGNLVDFNTEHPRARIVQVFIDASIPCKAPGSHAYIVVYQTAPYVRPAKTPKTR